MSAGLARKQADESLQLAKQQVQTLRNELSRASQQVLTAVRQARGRKSQELVRREESNRIRQLLDSLSPREREVFHLAGAGLPNKIIAERLGICLQTVKLHRGRLMRKLQLDSVAALGRLAEKAGIPPPSPTGLD